MGLDMYLYKRNKETKVDTEIGYWRKFNALHSYIANLKGRPDTNCERLWLSKQEINGLLRRLYEVKKILDDEGIPTTTKMSVDGFGNPTTVTEIQYDYSFSQETSDKVSAILAPQGGFFWGGTDIDGYYYSDILRTIEVFEDAKKIKEEGQDRIYYYSWW